MIIESKIRDLVSAYDEYSALKSRLGIGNFAFQFRDPDTNEIISDLSVIGKVPDNSDVISNDFPIRVIDGNAEMSNLILNIKAWR